MPSSEPSGMPHDRDYVLVRRLSSSGRRRRMRGILTLTRIEGHLPPMTKTKGRTGAHARANIQPLPTASEIEAATREIAQIEGRLAGLAAAHPSVKTWKARLRLAQAVIARAPRS